MPELIFYYELNQTRVDVDSALIAGARLKTCILQLNPTIEAALEDASRPAAVNALRDLLAGGPRHERPALEDMVSGPGPVLIVAPEYAFESDDWGAVDELVRSATRPIVLLAGFGATKGQLVLDWQGDGGGGGTERHLSWQQAVNPISSVMRVNGGWCWIHEPNNSTDCICYLKNVLQQGYEAVVLDDLQTGHTILHLRFSDLDLVTLICADLVQPAPQNAFSPQARVRDALAQVPADRPALIVGSLLQSGFNVNFPITIDCLLNTELAGRAGAVALCNTSHDRPEADENADKWRNFSGVFTQFSALPKGQQNFPATRALNAQGVVGAVVRQTHASATAGQLAWSPYNPVNGNIIWRGNMYCPIGAQGLETPIGAAPSVAACEISRFLRRHPPGGFTAPRLSLGIEALRLQIESGNSPDPGSMLRATLSGVSASKPFDPDELGGGEVTSALKAAVLAFLIAWNDFFFALIITRSSTVTAPVAIMNFVSYASVDWGSIALASIALTLPTVPVIIFANKYIVQSMGGAMKG